MGGKVIPLPMSPKTFLDDVVNPALATLPSEINSREALILLVAIALQESGLRTREQVDGPARGLWQFERNGVLAVMHNTRTADIAFHWCDDNGVTYGSNAIDERLAVDDELACVFARLLLWADPRALPDVGDCMGAFNVYERNWRPGKPSYTRWKDTAYPQALAAMQA